MMGVDYQNNGLFVDISYRYIAVVVAQSLPPNAGHNIDNGKNIGDEINCKKLEEKK